MTNTGTVAGADVVQVYVRDIEASVARPVRELKGFAKVALEPGESREVTLMLDQRAFSFWSEVHGRWVVEPGEFAVEVGHHSRNLPLSQTITVDGPSIAAPLTRDSSLQEWYDDPVARELILTEVAKGGPNPVGDEELMKVVGTMPMTTLAVFAGIGLDHETLDRLLAERAARLEA